MTNFVHALAVLEAARRPGEIRIHPHDAVEALAKAGLIMPDMPEPSYVVTECDEQYPVWEPGSDYSIEKEAPGEVTVSYHGEPAEPLTPQEARKLAHALLAEANYQEKA